MHGISKYERFHSHVLSDEHILVVQRNDKMFYCSFCKIIFGHDVNNWYRHLTQSKMHNKKLKFAGGGR